MSCRKKKATSSAQSDLDEARKRLREADKTLGEAKQQLVRKIEEQKLDKDCEDLKRLELQTTVNKLKLEVQQIEAAYTQASGYANSQEKNCQKIALEKVLAEKEILEITLQLETIKLTDHNNSENLKK